MRMCIEFVIQVLKQKNAHASFPVGMVLQRLSEAETTKDSLREAHG